MMADRIRDEGARGDEQPSEGDRLKEELRHSDLGMVRVYEDLIEILIRKHHISITELPLAAQEKFLRRKELRAAVSSLTSLLDSDVDTTPLP